MAVTIKGSGQVPVQIIQTVKTDTFATSSTSYIDITGLSVNITPTSSSNRVLVTVTVTGNSNVTGGGVRLLRDGTVIAAGAPSGGSPVQAFSGSLFAGGGDNVVTESVTFLDSPATTSAVTYKVQCFTIGTTYINRSTTDSNSYNVRSPSIITAMEISG
jgi:hypothetical protein